MNTRQFLKCLTDEELQCFRDDIFSEMLERGMDKLSKGLCAPLSEYEKELIGCGKRLEAIKSYRDRTSMLLYMAKIVVDDWAEKNLAQKPFF